MNIELENARLRLRIIELQGQILGYQHRDTVAAISSLRLLRPPGKMACSLAMMRLGFPTNNWRKIRHIPF
jgi:hypothetical protein